MKSTIHTPQVTKTLEALYTDATAQDIIRRNTPREPGPEPKTETEMFHAARNSYMAIGRDFGHLLYSLVRSTNAKTVVEFGTSFGISTIYLAAAIRDNGAGKIITSEFLPEKAAQAKKNLIAAGLEDCVEFRVGDATKTLAESISGVDMIFLDGAKSLYFDVLKLLEPHLRSGGIVAADNADHDGMENFLDYIRNPKNGYTSSPIFTGGERGKAHEITIRH